MAAPRPATGRVAHRKRKRLIFLCSLTRAGRACLIRGSHRDGQVAQLVEQRTENPRVGGSIPSLATILTSTDVH